MSRTHELFEAVEAGSLPRVTELIDQAPELVNARNEQGLSAVLFAMYYGQPTLAQLLSASGAVLNIFEASAIGQLGRVQELVAAQPDLVNAYADDGFQPLGLASFFGHTQVAEFLLGRGAKVNSPSRNAQHVMPLHSAVAGQHLTIARALVNSGADVNASQAGDFTPLHGAAQNGQVDMVELLLTHGADVSARAGGRTPLSLAVEKGHQAVSNLLRAHGAHE